MTDGEREAYLPPTVTVLFVLLSDRDRFARMKRELVRVLGLTVQQQLGNHQPVCGVIAGTKRERGRLRGRREGTYKSCRA